MKYSVAFVVTCDMYIGSTNLSEGLLSCGISQSYVSICFHQCRAHYISVVKNNIVQIRKQALNFEKLLT